MADDLPKLFAHACDTPTDINAFLPLLYDVVAAYTAPQVIELGVRDGNSTVALLHACAHAGGRLWSCDTDRLHGYAEVLRDHHPLWTFVAGSDLDPAVLAAGPQRCDVLFVDTVHTYTQTLDELRAWGPRVAPGGTILLHDVLLDVDHFGVCNAIHDWQDEQAERPEAVRWAYQAHGPWPGLAVLRRP